MYFRGSKEKAPIGIFYSIGLTFFILHSISLPAQTISLKDLQESTHSKYISISSQNDIFQLALQDDKYFSNGIHGEFAHPVFDNSVARKVLLYNNINYKSEYALAFGQDMYTPEDLSKSDVDSSDRPYCGLLYFSYTRHSNNIKTGSKIVCRLFAGVQGPVSGAENAQTIIHNIFDSEQPQGWNNQIQNGLLFDYELTLQRIVPVTNRLFELNVTGTAHAGTIYNFIQAGLMAKVGWFNYSYFQFDGLFNSKSKQGIYYTEDLRWSKNSKQNNSENQRRRTTYINRDFQIFLFVNPSAGYMLYDGTVQGSLIPFENSPYTLTYSDYKHSNGSLIFGLMMNYRSVVIQYDRVIKRDVYKGSGLYGWGVFKLSIAL